MLRRTKVERGSELGLPPRVVHTRRDLFSHEEEDFYEALFSGAQRLALMSPARGVPRCRGAPLFLTMHFFLPPLPVCSPRASRTVDPQRRKQNSRALSARARC